MSDKNIQDMDVENLSEKETEAYLWAIEKETPDLWNRISKEFDRELENHKQKTKKHTIKIIKRCGFTAAAVIIMTILVWPLFSGRTALDSDQSNHGQFGAEDAADLQTTEVKELQSINCISTAEQQTNDAAEMEEPAAADDQVNDMDSAPAENNTGDGYMYDASPVDKIESAALQTIKKIRYNTSDEKGVLSVEKATKFANLYESLNLMPQNEYTEVAEAYDIVYTIVYESGDKSELKLKKTGEVDIDGLKCMGNVDIVSQMIELYLYQ